VKAETTLVVAIEATNTAVVIVKPGALSSASALLGYSSAHPPRGVPSRSSSASVAMAAAAEADGGESGRSRKNAGPQKRKKEKRSRKKARPRTGGRN